MTTSHNKKKTALHGGERSTLFLVVGGSCYEDACKASRCARIAVIEARNECNRLEIEAVAKLYGGFDEEVSVNTYISFLYTCSCGSCISQRLRRQPAQL